MLLHNAHNAPRLLAALDSFVHETKTVNSEFRLWVSVQPDTDIPSSIIQSAVKIVADSPKVWLVSKLNNILPLVSNDIMYTQLLSWFASPPKTVFSDQWRGWIRIYCESAIVWNGQRCYTIFACSTVWLGCAPGTSSLDSTDHRISPALALQSYGYVCIIWFIFCLFKGRRRGRAV